MQLDCGCIREVLTHGEDDLPAEVQWPYNGHIPHRVPKGQIYCHHDQSAAAIVATPYRAIAEWGDRREVTFPADADHDESRTCAFWTVTLACGHDTEVSTDLEWRPADGPRRVSDARKAEMIAEVKGKRARTEVDKHIRRMIYDGWPMPQTEAWCFVCPHARLIVAYDPAGRLVPPPPKPPKPRSNKPTPASLKRRILDAEREAERLRNQLAVLEGDAAVNG